MHKKPSIKALLKEVDDDLQDYIGTPGTATGILGHPGGMDEEADTVLDELVSELSDLKTRFKSGLDVSDEFDRFVDRAAKTMIQPLHDIPVPEVEDLEDNSDFPTADEMFRQLFFGESIDTRVGFAYDRITEALVQRLGNKLPNANWTDLNRGATWFEEIDRFLVSVGVEPTEFSVSHHISERGNPFTGLLSGDFPSVGYLSLSEIEMTIPRLEALKLRPSSSEAAGPYVVDVLKWLKTCRKEECDLICFYG